MSFARLIEVGRSQAISVAIAEKVTEHLISEFAVFRLPGKESYCLVNTSIKLVFLNGWKAVLMCIFVKAFDFILLLLLSTFLFICLFN